MSNSNEFAKMLAERLPEGHRDNKSKSGSPLFFKEDTLSEKFSNLFGIKETKKFDEAFSIVAGGQGNEWARWWKRIKNLYFRQ